MMDWQNFHIELPEARFALMEAGEGPDVLLCLHGYEQNKQLFTPIFETIAKGWRVVLVDLPLYGETEWYDDQKVFSAEILQAFWSACGERYVGARLHLFGFSMGGKVALALQSSVRRGAANMILMAPDGIKSNFWHDLIRTSWGLRLNAWLDQHPQWVLKPAKWVYRLRLLDPLSYRILRLSYETAAARERKSRQLSIYSELEVDFTILSGLKDRHWHLIWGKKDKILAVGLSRKFMQLIPHAQLHLLEGGHMLIQERPQELAVLLAKIMHSLSTKAVDK